MPLDYGHRIGPYEITAKLGEGGMGEVYRAIDTELQRDVAIKILPAALTEDTERLARFRQEARLLAQLQHPNVTSVYGLEEYGGGHAIVMELVDGATLGDRLEEGFLPLEEALSIARQIGEALQAAHEKGIVHRDLKPQNIKLTRAGVVKVLDFGLAKRWALASESPLVEAPTLTRPLDTLAGATLGTVGYMAPEQVRGESVDRRADIFAFGCVLYEMLTGERAFLRNSSIETLGAILHEQPAPPSTRRRDLSPEMDRLVARCLEKDRSRRFDSCRELVDQLVVLGLAIEADGATPVPSLAVLPFADISAEHDQDYFCEGLAEELRSSLARIRGLRVASRTSSFQFKGLAADVREIGDRLGVGAVLEGSVRKSGNRLRINAQLVDPKNGYRLWSERYDRQLIDVFEIQDDIARRIVEALEVRLAASDLDRKTGLRAPNALAFDLYLRGRHFFYRGTRHDFELALEAFRESIDLDSRYAAPWAGIADCHSQVFREFDRRATYLLEARTAAERALELDPESPQGHAALAFALSLAGDRVAAVEDFEKALRLDPDLFEGWYLYASEMLYGWGDLQRAAQLFARASEIDRNDFQSLVILSSVYLGLGRPGDARDAAERGLHMARARLGLDPEDLRALYLSAQALTVLGQEERAVQLAGRVRQLDGDRSGLVLFNVAEVLAMVGRTDEALTCLEQAAARGFRRATAFRFAPFLAALHDSPRFLGLIDRMEREESSSTSGQPARVSQVTPSIS